MELLNKSQYALLALLELSKIYDTGESLQIKQIAVSQDIPVRYLEELMGTLRKGGLIKSIRGARGGYVLAREPKKITVLDAYKCIQGLDKVLSAGNITNKTLEVEIINSYWQEATTAAESVFQEKTLFDLCERLAKVQHMELMYYI
jgi:Rrf2 family protein